jgi:hypothetical protein
MPSPLTVEPRHIQRQRTLSTIADPEIVIEKWRESDRYEQESCARKIEQDIEPICVDRTFGELVAEQRNVDEKSRIWWETHFPDFREKGV